MINCMCLCMTKSAENHDIYNPVSRNFWKNFERLEKNSFFGPPQSLDEIIYVASDHLYKGNWR